MQLQAEGGFDGNQILVHSWERWRAHHSQTRTCAPPHPAQSSPWPASCPAAAALCILAPSFAVHWMCIVALGFQAKLRRRECQGER